MEIAISQDSLIQGPRDEEVVRPQSSVFHLVPLGRALTISYTSIIPVTRALIANSATQNPHLAKKKKEKEKSLLIPFA